MTKVNFPVDKSLEQVQPSNDRVTNIIAGTDKGLWFFQDSEQWLEHEGHSITAISASDEGLWVIVDANSVYHRNKMGKWNLVTSVEELELKCILPTKTAVWVGTSQAHLIRIADNEMKWVKSIESTPGHEEWYTPWGGPPAVRSLAVGVDGELYVNIHVGGILRSDDQGMSWQPTIDIKADVHQVITVSNHPQLVLAATAEGLAISQDKGNSWDFEQKNLHSTYARGITVCKETIFMTTCVGPHGGKSAVYRRPLFDNKGFEKCQQGLPEWFSGNINTGNLVSKGNTVAFATKHGQIFVSEDAGLTWGQTEKSLTAINCLCLS